MIAIDSYGWLERFTDGPKAVVYNRLIDSETPGEIVTSIVSVYDVYKKLKHLRGESAALEAVAQLRSTRVVPLDESIALEAADFSLSRSLHFADAVVYATARRFHATLHTSDPDFKDVPGATLH
jgi:predicted nucleic acid-binding protein